MTAFLIFKARQLFLGSLLLLILHGVVLNVRIIRVHPKVDAAASALLDEPSTRAMSVVSPSSKQAKELQSIKSSTISDKKVKKKKKNTLDVLKAPSLPVLSGAAESLFEGLPDAKPSYLLSQQEVMDYANSFQSFNRSLSFLHIPKTGGSTVENANTQLPWGKCLFIGQTPPPEIKLNPCPWQLHPHALQMMHHDVPDWHVPAHFFPFAKANPYANQELFVVLRLPPLERAISQYFWFCAEVRRSNERQLRRKYCGHRKRHAQRNIQTYFRDRLHPTTLRGYLQDHGHWIPQYDYVVGPLQVRYATHVLQLASMRADYPRLGRAYGLDLEWPETRANAQAHNKDIPSVTKEIQDKVADHFAMDWKLVSESERRLMSA